MLMTTAARADQADHVLDLKANALALIEIEACRLAWDRLITADVRAAVHKDPSESSTLDHLDAVPTREVSRDSYDRNGTRYTYRSSALTQVDVCGGWFVPTGEDARLYAAGKVEREEIAAHKEAFAAAAAATWDAIAAPKEADKKAAADQAVRSAIDDFSKDMMEKAQSFSGSQELVDKFVVYGLPTIYTPAANATDYDRPSGFMAMYQKLFAGGDSDEAWKVRVQTAREMSKFYDEIDSLKSVAEINNHLRPIVQ